MTGKFITYLWHLYICSIWNGIKVMGYYWLFIYTKVWFVIPINFASGDFCVHDTKWRRLIWRTWMPGLRYSRPSTTCFCTIRTFGRWTKRKSFRTSVREGIEERGRGIHSLFSGHTSGGDQWGKAVGEANSDQIDHQQRIHLRDPIREQTRQFCELSISQNPFNTHHLWNKSFKF